MVGADGELVGVMPTPKALELARERDLDLVEVAPRSRPPVCRIMDYGKYKYELSKRAKKARSRQHQIQLKEMRVRPKIEEHDYEFKSKKVRGFLEERDKVRVTVIFRGREMTHPDRGEKILKRFVADMAEVGVQEGPIRREGRNMVLMLIPRTSSMPKGPAVAPKAASGAPKAASGAPKTASGAPKTASGAPKTTMGAPRSVAGAPDTASGAPKTTSAAPKTTSAAPKTTSAAPKTTPGAPKTAPGAPKTAPAAPGPSPEKSGDGDSPELETLGGAGEEPSK